MGIRIPARCGPLAALVAVAAVSAGPAGAFPTIGTQPLLVVPVEYAHSGCPPGADGTPTCPRNTAAELQAILQNALTAYYGNPATGSLVSWRVRVLADPDTANGWWPAPSTVQGLAARANARGMNWNAYTAKGSPVRDAAEVVVARALRRGVVSASELGASTRFLAIHNWHVPGGQSSGNLPLAYTASYARRRSATYTVTAAFVNEGPDDGQMARLVVHELAHELGPWDLSGEPCPLWPPGEIPALPFGNDLERTLRTDCVGTWDLMGLTGERNAGPSYYTRAVLGWVPTLPPSLRYEPGVFSGEFELSSLEYPNGEPLALHIPEDPNRQLLAGTFGNGTDFQGWLAECRRTAWDDPVAPPGQGLLISYVDGARPPGERQLVVVRRSDDPLAMENTDRALLKTGETFRSHAGGFTVRFNGFTTTGGCIVVLDRPTVLLETASFIPAVNAQESLFAPDLGLRTARALWSNPGVVLNGPKPLVTARSLARSVRVRAPARGRPSTIRFVYGNAGGRSGKGTAVVRVRQPWAATAACGAPDGPRGRVLDVVGLPRLAPGAAAVGTAKWRPRSSAPVGVTVTLRGETRPFAEAESASTVVGFTTFRTRTVRIPLTLAAGEACMGKVPYLVTPAIVPKGWRASVEGTATPLRLGHPVHVTVVLRRPPGNAPAATDVPVAVSFGSSSVDTLLPAEGDGALGSVPVPGFTQTVGIDLLVRTAPPGRRLPGFTVPPAARIRQSRFYPLPMAPTGPPFHQTLAITECTQATGATGQSVFVRGAGTPLRIGVPVHLTYTSIGGALAPGTVVERTVTTFFPTGLFSDTFNRQGSSWIVVGRLDEEELYSDAVSLECAVPAP
jgi:hypothetical protein